MNEKNFRLVGQLLSQAITEKGWDKFLALEQLKRDWPKVVGVNIAEHSQPVFISDYKLSVEVESSIWANQLNFLKDKVMETINEYYKKEVVKDIFFRIKK